MDWCVRSDHCSSALVHIDLVCVVEMFDCHQAPELMTKGASPATDMFAYGRSVKVIYQLRQELQHEVPADQVRSPGVFTLLLAPAVIHEQHAVARCQRPFLRNSSRI